MRFREPRDPETRRRQPDSSTTGPTGEGPDRETLAAARELIRVGDDAIDRALSRDPERFLAENRQRGGQ